MAFRDVWVGRWNAEGAGIFGMVRVDKSEDLLGCFFSLFLFFFLFSFRRGVTGNFLEMGFTSGLTSRVKYLSKLFSWNRFFFFLRRSSDYFSFVFFGFSDKVIT